METRINNTIFCFVNHSKDGGFLFLWTSRQPLNLKNISIVVFRLWYTVWLKIDDLLKKKNKLKIFINFFYLLLMLYYGHIGLHPHCLHSGIIIKKKTHNLLNSRPKEKIMKIVLVLIFLSVCVCECVYFFIC